MVGRWAALFGVGCILFQVQDSRTAQGPLAAAAERTTRFPSYDEAHPVFEALAEPMPSRVEWPQWIAKSSRSTRARVAGGDETSVVNLLLFGTSFTHEPRVTSRQLDRGAIAAAVDARLRDFEGALQNPPDNERMQFARRVIGSAPVRPRLEAMLERSIQEGEIHARLIAQAAALEDPSLQFAERSRIYRARGLSSDTSLRVNLAVEKTLRSLTSVLSRASDRSPFVERVAIVGPGLDFVDKQEGYDFYPVQTLQPFAIIDSLIRLRLAERDRLTVTTFDVSLRVNEHLAQAGSRALGGSPYVLHLPLDGAVPWSQEPLDYWRQFGDQIGSAVPTTIPAGIGAVRLRAVGVRPPFVKPIVARDLDITTEHLELEPTERFDLIIATNILVYYDRLQQGLAMANIAKMLRPGGVLLSNNALVEVPAVGLKSGGYSKTLYSNREEDGDIVIWYQMPVR
jgi:hypothetical protein